MDQLALSNIRTLTQFVRQENCTITLKRVSELGTRIMLTDAKAKVATQFLIPDSLSSEDDEAFEQQFQKAKLQFLKNKYPAKYAAEQKAEDQKPEEKA